MALLACAFWGVSAVATQVVFETYSFPPLGLVAIRMSLAGLILYAVFRPARPKGRLAAFVMFSVVGLWLVQLAYFLTIDSSNAATATLLQFLALPIIAAYEILSSKARVTVAGVLAVVLATVGTAELVAGRSDASVALLITPVALIAGLLTAATTAYYILASKPLLKAYGSMTVTTWGLLFGSFLAIPAGSVPLSDYSIPAASGGIPELLALVAFIVVFGTLLSFLLYFKGLEKITPTEAGITAAMEPIVAAAVSFFLLHVVLTPFQYLGGILIIGAVAIIALKDRPPPSRRTGSPRPLNS